MSESSLRGRDNATRIAEAAGVINANANALREVRDRVDLLRDQVAAHALEIDRLNDHVTPLSRRELHRALSFKARLSWLLFGR